MKSQSAWPRSVSSRLFAVVLAATCIIVCTGIARSQTPPLLISPELHPDNRVTFRFRAPNAKEVFFERDGATRQPMTKDDQGVWSITSDPLEPDIYGYSFVVDGSVYFDPLNPLRRPNFLYASSEVHVPGPGVPWEATDVPHGELHRHFYHSIAVGDNRDFFVYTPPGYDPKSGKGYPVLYLLHGFSDDASAWSTVGRANYILDNLIAQGKAKPMLVVMPLGYGAPEIVLRTNNQGPRDPNIGKRNMDKFGEALITEVIPEIERSYRVSKDRNMRAIAGLSMGGAESLTVGLNNIPKFGWVGSFSAGGLNGDFTTVFPALDSKVNSQLHLLWVACGVEDRLIDPNRKFRDWLKSKSINHVDVETPGAHQWPVWRRNLATFAPLLFR